MKKRLSLTSIIKIIKGSLIVLSAIIMAGLLIGVNFEGIERFGIISLVIIISLYILAGILTLIKERKNKKIEFFGDWSYESKWNRPANIIFLIFLFTALIFFISKI